MNDTATDTPSTVRALPPIWERRPGAHVLTGKLEALCGWSRDRDGGEPADVEATVHVDCATKRIVVALDAEHPDSPYDPAALDLNLPPWGARALADALVRAAKEAEMITDELRRSVERHIRTEHPLVWETFEPHDAEYLTRHGTVDQNAVNGGWYVACDEPCDEGMFCAHAGPFESEAAAWERLDALRDTPQPVLSAWQEVAG